LIFEDWGLIVASAKLLRKRVGGKKPAARPKLREIERVKKERTSYPLAAFMAAPKNWHFETQEKEERIILLLRRHWLTNLGWILTSALLMVAPQFFLLFASLDFMPLRFRLMGILIWYLVLVGFIFERFLNWFFNVFIITDERIIDFDFYGLIYKEISDAKIETIQDVTYKVAGFFRNLFDFGDVFIQTAAQVPKFEFHDVPQPARVAKILRELITEEEIEKIEGRVR
jgi:uncharacterized membrane protein YdbT with pleckstrin-like domain